MKCKHCETRLAIYGPEGGETICYICREIQLSENRRERDAVAEAIGNAGVGERAFGLGHPAAVALGRIIRAESWARYCLGA